MVRDWELKHFKQEHADQIVSYGMNHKLMEIDASYKENRICSADKGNAYTLFLNKKPIVAGGIIIVWNGVAEGWILANRNIFDIRFLAPKVIKIQTEKICRKNKIRRLQTSVKAEFIQGVRFANWLGLETEGLMRKYGPDGSDYYRMARIF